MKYLNNIIVLFLCVFLFIPSIYAKGHNKNISISFNHDGCNEQSEREITFQLFADGEMIEGSEVTLNSSTGYNYVYQDLPVFKKNYPEEIVYDIKVLENGVYKLIPENNYSFEKGNISKWVQVLPENIKSGHTYVLTTDNLNYASNGFSKTIYLRGDITAKGAPVIEDYNIIDGVASYYSLAAEPIENTKWSVSLVNESDEDYNEFKDYLVFTNEGGKKLTLTGYNNNGNIHFIYKYSSKNGYIESEDAMYTNKVKIFPVERSKGTFVIGTKNLYPEPNNSMQYITLSNMNQYMAGNSISNATQFKAYEYVDSEVELGNSVIVNVSMCQNNETIVIDKHTKYKKNIDVKIDYSHCQNTNENNIIIQLFADGIKVEGEQKELTKENNYSYVYKNLPIFDEDSVNEIKYEVKVYNNGKYLTLPSNSVVNETNEIKGWVQVFPEDIKPDHTYILVTENLNYMINGFSKNVYLRGDITAKGAKLITQYNIINGKKYYYMLDGEPINNSKWVVTSVTEEDDNYNEFKDYLMFNNEAEKKLTLTGYNRGNNIDYIFKHSSKNGYIESEDAMYTNKVTIIPSNDTTGTFIIGSKILVAESNEMMQYLYLDENNQFKANSEVDDASKFIALEYIEEESIVASEEKINTTFCEVIDNKEVCEIDKLSIESINMNNKTGNTIELSDPMFLNKNMYLNLKMMRVGDSIEYKFEVKNSSQDDFKIDESSFDFESEYFDFEVIPDNDNYIIKKNSNKTFTIKIKYKNKVPDDMFNSGIYNIKNKGTINLLSINNGEKIINPKTGDNINVLVIIVLLFLSVFLFVTLRKQERTKIMMPIIIILVLTIPTYIFALCKTEIKINVNISVKNNYNIILNPTGGTVDEDIIETNIDNTIENLPVPTRKGYRFIDWYADENYVQLVSELDKDDTEDIVLYAKWEELPIYTITYVLNGGTNPSNVITSYKEDDEDIILKTPTGCVNCIFNGWYTESTFENRIERIEKGSTGDKTLYAKWTVRTSSLEYINRKVEGEISVGDEVAFGSEHFYIISSNDEKTALIAKYNLLVGATYKSDNSCQVNDIEIKKKYSSSDLGYCLQKSNADGTVPFSGVNYWDGNQCYWNDSGTYYSCSGTSGLLPAYSSSGSYNGNPYPNIYDKNLSTKDFSIVTFYLGDCPSSVVKNNGYTISYFGELYKSKLIQLGAPSDINSRMLTYEESNLLGCTMTSCTGAPSWLINGNYWLGSTYGSDYVFSINNNRLTGLYSENLNVAGVRPVIEIKTNIID